MRTIVYIVIHCSATSERANVGRAEIDVWHRDQGWSGIGYHYVIRRNGDIEIGRPAEEVGAHVKGFNAHSLGICLVGGVNERKEPVDNFTSDQWDSLGLLVDGLQRKYPTATVCGHRDFPNVDKACPSFDVLEWRRATGRD